MRLAPPTKYPTPFGGRLEWTLPGGNKLVAHLKDKTKIRHKKRWSQVTTVCFPRDLLQSHYVNMPMQKYRLPGPYLFQ